MPRNECTISDRKQPDTTVNWLADDNQTMDRVTGVQFTHVNIEQQHPYETQNGIPMQILIK